MAVHDERGRPSAVEVDRISSAEIGHDSSQLCEREPCFARRAPLAHNRDELLRAQAEGGTWVAASGDVRVELTRAGGEALRVGARLHQADSVTHEKRTCLQQVTGR